MFAFTDLSFLLLIVLSLIPSSPDVVAIRLKEMDIPDVPIHSGLSPVKPDQEIVELRVYAVTESHPKPFKLIKSKTGSAGYEEMFAKELDADELIAELETMRSIRGRPLLLPEKNSLSKDLLFAAGAIAKIWPTQNSPAIVKPIDEEKS